MRTSFACRILLGLLLAVGACAASGPPAPLPPVLFSFRADSVPMKQALALFARANGLTIVPDLDVDGNVTVEFANLPLDQAMSALLEASGYYFEQDGRLLRVRKEESRIFHVDYIRTTRTSQGSSGVQITSGEVGSGAGSGAGSQGSGGAAEGSTMNLTNSSTINFWGELSDQLKSMVSATGRFTVDSLSGTIFVTDAHRNVEAIAQFLSAVTSNIVRQVDLEVDIYEVALRNDNQLGINWQVVAGKLAANSIPSQLGLGAGGGLIVQNPLYGTAPGDPGVQATFQSSKIQAVLDALKQEGRLKVVSTPRLRTLNNQPAVVRIGQDLPVFTEQVTEAPGTPPVITTNTTIQTVTVGTVLSITPQISDDGLITLDVTPAVSRLVGIQTATDGKTSAPVIDIRQASSLVRVRDGATVVMGGLVQDSSSSTRRKIPLLGDVPLLGKAFQGTYTTSERTELVFFLTPRIVRDPSTEPTAPMPGLASTSK